MPRLVFVAFPRAAVEPRGDPAGGDLAQLDIGLDALARRVGRYTPAPEGRPEVDQVVAYEPPIALLDQNVQRVVLLGVEVVQPGGDDVETAQFAAMLMRYRVGGIVVTPALEVERTEQRSLQEPAGPGTDATVGAFDPGAQHLLQGRVIHRVLAAQLVLERQRLRGLDPGRIEVGDEELGHMVAGRVEQPGRYHFGRARHFLEARRIELDDVARASRVFDRKARGHSSQLRTHDRPGPARVGSGVFAASAPDCLRRHAHPAVPMGEPARIAHVVFGGGIIGFDLFSEPGTERAGRNQEVRERSADILIEPIRHQARIALLRNITQ